MFQRDYFAKKRCKTYRPESVVRLASNTGNHCRRRYSAITPEFALFDLICGRCAQFKEGLR
jgi:hypothetical protein